MIVLLVIVFGLIGLVDFPSLVKKNKRRERIILISFYITVFILATMPVFGFKLPSPVPLIISIVNGLGLTYSK